MSLPSIAIINFSSRSDQEVQDAIRAINRQVEEDFMPVWGSGRLSKLYAASFDPANVDTLTEETIPADSVIYIVDEPSVPGALGYHSINSKEVPVGFVFEDLGDWTVTLSHEILELIVDPTVNIFVPGADPRDSNFWLFHSYEVCDAVERSTYRIDNIEVSNFVTPEYFNPEDIQGTRNDFLGVGVESFGVTQGSHLGVLNPATWDFEIIFGAGAPVEPVFAKRQKAYEHERPQRQDEKLTALLDSYNEKPPAGCSSLPELGGLTHAARYKKAGRDLANKQR